MQKGYVELEWQQTINTDWYLLGYQTCCWYVTGMLAILTEVINKLIIASLVTKHSS